MKFCPVCGRDYVDELSYCLEDGTPLSEQKATERKTEKFGEQETFARPSQTVASSAPTAQPNSPNKIGIFFFVTLLVLGLLVLLSAGIAGIWYYISKKNEVANSNRTNINRGVNWNRLSNNAPNIATGNNSNSGATTVPSPTRDASPGKTPGNKAENTSVPVPTPEKTQQVPKTISGGVLNGKAVFLPKPPYPPAARAANVSGAVSVQVMIDEEGNVISATAVSGHPLLRAAAAAAARGAKFSPTKLAGQPVKVSGVITYNFVP